MPLLRAYFAERFDPRVYLPLAMIIAAAASGGTFSAVRLGVDATFALLLLAQFRVWDDLADRHRDARTHPERVLVRASARAASIAPVVACCGALTALNVGLALRLDASGVAVVMLIALVAVLGSWYLLRRQDAGTRTGPRTAAGDHLLLSKYAAMVVIVAGARVLQAPARIVGAALLLHLAACVYEAWHDPASPLSVGGSR